MSDTFIGALKTFFMPKKERALVDERDHEAWMIDYERQKAFAKLVNLQFNKLLTGHGVGTTTAHIILKKGERLLCEISGVMLMEARAVRVSNGRYGGVSFRAAKGISVHTGGFGSTSESHEQLRCVDEEGTLSLTNKRIVFSGSLRTAVIPFEKYWSLMGLVYL